MDFIELCRKIYIPTVFVVQIIVSCIINPVTFYIIKKETEKKYEVALVFLLFQFLYLNCEIMRETIAISMFYFAFSFYIKRRWLPYYGICAVCFFFMMLPSSIFSAIIVSYSYKGIYSKIRYSYGNFYSCFCKSISIV